MQVFLQLDGEARKQLEAEQKELSAVKAAVAAAGPDAELESLGKATTDTIFAMRKRHVKTKVASSCLWQRALSVTPVLVGSSHDGRRQGNCVRCTAILVCRVSRSPVAAGASSRQTNISRWLEKCMMSLGCGGR